MSVSVHHQVIIVGGGSAGISVAARLTKGWFNKLDVAVIEPSDKHYYQPLWTLVGGGVVKKEVTEHTEASVMPRRAKWIRDGVAEFHPDQNYVVTRGGQKITYDWLVVAAGIQINWDKIAGLKESVGKNGVCSNYSYDTVDSTWEHTTPNLTSESLIEGQGVRRLVSLAVVFNFNALRLLHSEPGTSFDVRLTGKPALG